jgi:hypothetical protein
MQIIEFVEMPLAADTFKLLQISTNIGNVTEMVK